MNNNKNLNLHLKYFRKELIIKKVADKLKKFNYKLIMKNYKIKNKD